MGAAGGLPTKRCLRDHHSWCGSVGPRRRSHPFLWRQRVVLWPLNDETLHAQSLHRGARGLFLGAESDCRGLSQRRHRARRCGTIPSFRARVAADAHAAGCSADSIRSSSSPTSPMVPHVFGGTRSHSPRMQKKGMESSRLHPPQPRSVPRLHGAVAHLPRRGLVAAPHRQGRVRPTHRVQHRG